MRQLADLVQSTPFEVVRGELAVPVERVSSDSRDLGPRDLFVAVRGTRVDGHRFVPDAVRSGVGVLVVERDVDLNGFGGTVLRVPSTREALGAMLRAFHGAPDREMQVLAVTGTNGKTTVSHLLRDLWTARGVACGLLGTIEYDTLAHRIAAPLTTPGVEQLYPLLAEIRGAGGVAVSMEASSHALDQDRLHGVEVDIAVFTNLTREHLDYHADLDDYLGAKRRLLLHLEGDGRTKPRGRAVVNLDDERLRAVSWPEGTITVGHRADCDVQGLDACFDKDGTSIRMRCGDEVVELRTRLLGLYNAYNLLSVAGVALASGISTAELMALTPALSPVPGRLEPVVLEGGPLAIVDYAHTPDGLRNTLEAVRRVASGRIHLVFGCGGDRDRGKRPEMAAVALAGADEVFLTLDNPRTEDPEQIFADTEAGFASDPSRARRIPDRAEAIAAALDVASQDDVVLVAGKGHETYQLIGDTRLPWDDRQAVRDAFANRGSAR